MVVEFFTGGVDALVDIVDEIIQRVDIIIDVVTRRATTKLIVVPSLLDAAALWPTGARR